MNSLDPISSACVCRADAVRAADRRAPVEVQAPVRARDTVDLSEKARLLDALRSQPDYRPDVVERVKGEIAEGTYLTDEKLDKALDALIDDLMA